MKNLLFPLLCNLLLFSLVLQSSCNPDDYGPCEEDPFPVPQNAGITIAMVLPNSNQQEYLLDILRYPCDRDSVAVFRENGEKVDEFYFESDGVIAFRVNIFDMDHSEAFRQEVSKSFTLYINYLETHQITTKYKMRETGCNYDVFEFVEVFFDNELQARAEDALEIPDILIEKDSLNYNRCR